MAHWNPFGRATTYVYNGNGYQNYLFNPNPYQQTYNTNFVSYETVPTNSTASSIRTVEEIEKEYRQDKNNRVKNSNLTATAAEFKPGCSYKSSESQVFTNSNQKQEEVKLEKSPNNPEPAPSTSNNGTGSKQKNIIYSRHQKKKNKNENAPRYSKDKEYKKENKDNRNYRSNRSDYNEASEAKGGSNPNYYRDNFGNKNKYRQEDRHRNGESSRSYYDYNDRGSSDHFYSNDKYRSSNGRNSYRNSNKEERKTENWRDNLPSIGRPENRYGDNSARKNEKDNRYTNKSKNYKEKSNKNKIEEVENVSQRDRLIEQVNKGTLECLVCCETVRQVDKVWSCQKCYHIFHLRCSLKWAEASKDDNGWRCPACQHVNVSLPDLYKCYCGQVPEPIYRPGDTAHSCGGICSKQGLRPGCPHKCKLLCHPGPCPTCEDLITRTCKCGATKQMVKCNADVPLICKAPCGKTLNCGIHVCPKTCHASDCLPCAETIKQECYCGKNSKEISCTIDQLGVSTYSCDTRCDKPLRCGHHTCEQICHPGECSPCIRDVQLVKTCACGKTESTVQRQVCTDPIPTCDKVCGKRFQCGQPSSPHSCQENCHDGQCPPCPLTTLVKCRCGHMNKEIPCTELSSRADDARCEKKCQRKRSCAKHKCNQLCCIDVEHICFLPCNRMLSCGQHRCELNCHKGRCPPCLRSSFDELYCECGVSVIYPPVPCGTKPPACNMPCSRRHHCEHDALHTCHTSPVCPPCTVLTTKWCHGKHEKRSTIPCHQKEFSCGLPCNKELPCGRHKCQLPCHLGPCLREDQNCVQTCSTPRETCGHPCGLPCHEPPCQDSPCKESVRVSCECGLRTSTRACMDMTSEYQRMANSVLASKMADMQLGHSIDVNDIMSTTRKQVLRTLECNDECHIVERNRRMAIGLQLKNPDLSAKLTPKYSDFMKQWAKKDSRFCQLVHDKLTELVQLAKQSKQKSRSYSFESMNRDKRHFVHEYCEHFGCESAAYDQEPNRNVVATAVKDKAWLPSCSLLQLLQRESGQRKVPGPILNRPLGSARPSGPVSLKMSTSRPTASSSSQRSKTPEGENIDYFDYTPMHKHWK